MKQNRTINLFPVLKAALLLLPLFFSFQNAENVFGAQTKLVNLEPAAAKDNTAIGDKSSTLSKNQVDFAGIANADDKLGLKLIGTVTTNFRQNVAIIESINGNGQHMYHEGDKVDGYVIKRISRKNIIISPVNSDKLLNLGSSHGSVASENVSLSQPETETSANSRSGGRYRSIELPPEDIVDAIDDIDMLIEDGETTLYRLGRLTGFRIKSVPEESILKKIGLKLNDVILSLNEKSIDTANGSFNFNKQISEGKKVTIKYRRRNRTRRIELNPI